MFSKSKYHELHIKGEVSEIWGGIGDGWVTTPIIMIWQGYELEK